MSVKEENRYPIKFKGASLLYHHLEGNGLRRLILQTPLGEQESHLHEDRDRHLESARCLKLDLRQYINTENG